MKRANTEMLQGKISVHNTIEREKEIKIIKIGQQNISTIYFHYEFIFQRLLNNKLL